MDGWMDVDVKCLTCQINTYWKLLALPSRLANFTGGATFSRLLLCHQVHVQYCAFTLSKQIQTSCTTYLGLLITGVILSNFFRPGCT